MSIEKTNAAEEARAALGHALKQYLEAVSPAPANPESYVTVTAWDGRGLGRDVVTLPAAGKEVTRG